MPLSDDRRDPLPDSGPGHTGAGGADATMPHPSAAVPRPAGPVGTRVRDYEIVGKLGEGGMGVVFEARQQHPRRAVALKVIRGGRFVDDVALRLFQREADTLGRLKHPNIAAIYESGQTEEGQHFFAMELVRGKTLDHFVEARCPEGALPRSEIRFRLGLFRQICDAVHYAHQRGVIHRDLKPSNVLVAQGEDDRARASTPTVKILDFGLARITDPDIGATMVSEVGAIRGTLAYMSPEQARGDPGTIDLRTDVYSLGVILYRLLTGTFPYETSTSSLVVAVQTICEQPPRPLRGLERAPRNLDPDLQTICLKALEKDPDRRYASAAALSEDVDRYLRSLPIHARPPSAAYQLRKLVARNRLQTAFAATVLLLLVGFGAWMAVLYGRARVAEAKASREAATAKQVSDFLTGLFEVSTPSEAAANSITAREILDQGALKLSYELADQPEVRANLLGVIGTVYVHLSLFQQADSLLQESLQIATRVHGAQSAEVAKALGALGGAEVSGGDYAAAERHLRQALDIWSARLPPGDVQIAIVQTDLGATRTLQGDFADAESLLTRAAAIYRAYPPDPNTVKCLGYLAEVQTKLGRFDEAEASLRREVELTEQIFGKQHSEVAKALNDLGSALQQHGKFDEAEAVERQALAIRERTLGPDHVSVASTLSNLAGVLTMTGRLQEALPYSERAVAIVERRLGPDNPMVMPPLTNLASLYSKVGRLDDAVRMSLRALQIGEQTRGVEHPDVGLVLNNLAAIYLKQEKYAEAEPLCQRALKIFSASLGPEHPNVGLVHRKLGVIRREQGRLEEARQQYQQATAILQQGFPPNHPQLVQAMEEYAGVLRRLNRVDEAAQIESQLAAIRGS